MQKVTTYPKIELPLKRTPQEVLKVWKRAQGIWKRKKTDPIKYLQRARREWKRRVS